MISIITLHFGGNTFIQSNINVDINIAKGNTTAIKLNNKQTSSHFENQSIFGIVTSMINENGTKVK